MDKAIEVQSLKKYYGDVYAVKGIDFYVEKGKLFAFLGPNGAGKSTTINMITTLLSIDEGVIHVDGLQVGVDDVLIRQRIGIVFQDHFLDALLTVKENLLTRASFYGGTRAEIEERGSLLVYVYRSCPFGDGIMLRMSLYGFSSREFLFATMPFKALKMGISKVWY